jgi:hypothetical protein
MGDFAEYLLHQLYAFGASVAAQIGTGLGEINSRLKKLDYADWTARDRIGGPTSEAFPKKRDKAIENAGRADWPFQNQQVETFADATRTYPVMGMLPLHRAMAAIGDGRQALQHYGGKQLLAILRAGAKARGIHISLTEFSELAYAAMIYAAGEGANPKPLDKNTLQRFFAFPDIERLERAFQRRFEASEEWDLEAIAAEAREEIARRPS